MSTDIGHEHEKERCASTVSTTIDVSLAPLTGAFRHSDLQVVGVGNYQAGEELPLEDFLDLDEALDRLSKRDLRKAWIVQLKFFGGFEHQEIARLFDVSVSTIAQDWAFSRAWLTRELSVVQPGAGAGPATSGRQQSGQP